MADFLTLAQLQNAEMMDAERERLENELIDPLEKALADFIDALASAAASTVDGDNVALSYAPPSFLTAAGVRLPFSKDTARSLWNQKVTPAMTSAVEKVTGKTPEMAAYASDTADLMKSILSAGNDAASKAYDVISPRLLSSPLLQRAAIARDLTRSLDAEGWAAGIRRESRHTATLMHNRKTLASMQHLGLENKTWAAMHDERTRPHHREADGQTVPVDQPFNIAGLSMMYPGDPSAPMSETANCRCVIIAKRR